METSFYMICRAPTHRASKTEPKARYRTREEAVQAAKDLSASTDAPFVVLAVDQVVHPSDRSSGSLFDPAH